MIPLFPNRITHVYAPTKLGMIIGSIPKERISFLPGILTLATQYPIGIPIKRENSVTEILTMKEFLRLFIYRLLVKNCLNPSRDHPGNSRPSTGFQKALRSVKTNG